METRAGKFWTWNSFSSRFRRSKKATPGVNSNTQAPISTYQAGVLPAPGIQSSPFEATSEQIHPEVVNFLIIWIKAAATNKVVVTTLPGCPNSREDIVKLLKKLPKYKDAAQLKKALDLPRTKEENLLFWICNTYGSTFALATEKFIIPGFASDVQQFIITNPVNSSRQDLFEQELEKAKGKSAVLFHGTSLDNLFSIMSDGFRASTDLTYGKGNFMGDAPRTAYIYAHHRACLIRDKATGNYATEKWNWRSSRDRAVMLGCQVTGNGRVVNDVSERTGKVHVIENMQSIAVRYIFLLPDIQYKSRDEDFNAPDKKIVEKPLGEAFKKFPTKKQMEEEKRKRDEAERLAEETRKKEETRRKEETVLLEEVKAAREQKGFPWTSPTEEVKSMREQLHLPGLPVLC